MPLFSSIVHRLEPGADGESLTLAPASAAQPVSEPSEALAAALNDTFNAKPRGWGRFAEEGDAAAPVAAWFKDWLAGEDDFAGVTRKIAERLAHHLAGRLGVGGYLVFADQQQGDTRTLLLALVHQREGIGIDADHRVVPAAQLNTRQLTLAARLNLTQWQGGDEQAQYASFTKERGGSKLAQALAECLGLVEGADAPADTRTLLKAFSDYVEKKDLDDEQSREKTDALVGYASEQLSRGEPMTLAEVSELMDEQQPRAFYDHIRNADYGLAPEIPPDKRTLNQFRRFTGRAGGVSISFDSHLLGGSVEYDEAGDRLIIKKVPAKLKEQLTRGDTHA